jgi:hypothetical protein
MHHAVGWHCPAHLFDLVWLELWQHCVALDLLHDAGINVVLVKLPADTSINAAQRM